MEQTYGLIAGSNAILWWWERMQRYFLTQTLINRNKILGCYDHNWIKINWRVCSFSAVGWVSGRGLWRHRAQVWQPGTKQVGRRLLLWPLQGLLSRTNGVGVSVKLCRSFFCCWRKYGGMPSVCLDWGRKSDAGRRDGRKAIIIFECAFSLRRPQRDGRSAEEETKKEESAARSKLWTKGAE